MLEVGDELEFGGVAGGEDGFDELGGGGGGGRASAGGGVLGKGALAVRGLVQFDELVELGDLGELHGRFRNYYK